jgi:uncharacterized protein (TIGR00251 family)
MIAWAKIDGGVRSLGDCLVLGSEREKTMIQISDHVDGCIIQVRAQPRARQNELVGEHAGALKIAVTAAPEQGRANDAIIELLCERLGLKKGFVELHSGAGSRNKKILIRNMAAAQIAGKLSNLMGPLLDGSVKRESKSR